MKRFDRFLSELIVVTLLTCFLAACGKPSDKDTTGQEATAQETEIATATDNNDYVDIGDNTDIDELATDTEAATEAVIAPADVAATEQTETTEEETTEEVTVSDNGSAIFKGVSIQLPEGYEYSADNSSIDAACFMNSDKETCLILCVDDNNTVYDESNLESVFDSQIKAVYGEQVTHDSKAYNELNGIEWVLDNETEETCGRAFVVMDGKMLIYVEFFGYGDQTADYEAVVNSMQY